MKKWKLIFKSFVPFDFSGRKCKINDFYKSVKPDYKPSTADSIIFLQFFVRLLMKLIFRSLNLNWELSENFSHFLVAPLEMRTIFIKFNDFSTSWSISMSFRKVNTFPLWHWPDLGVGSQLCLDNGHSHSPEHQHILFFILCFLSGWSWCWGVTRAQDHWALGCPFIWI